jgi:hypothetical protein
VLRVGAIRVAITKTTPSATSFSFELLDAGQQAPAGTIEAMLVIPGGIEGISSPRA